MMAISIELDKLRPVLVPLVMVHLRDCFVWFCSQHCGHFSATSPSKESPLGFFFLEMGGIE